MPDISAGSIALNLFNGISPMPAGVSGLLITIVNNKRYFVEQWTGATIGNSIPESYQSPITDLAMADTLRFMASQDFGAQEMSIGGRDLVMNNLNLKDMADQMEKRAIFGLKSLSKSMKFYKARG